jgi:hypothetical protein
MMYLFIISLLLGCSGLDTADDMVKWIPLRAQYDSAEDLSTGSIKAEAAESEVNADSGDLEVASDPEVDGGDLEIETDTAESEIETDTAESEIETDTAESEIETDTAESEIETDTAESEIETDTAEPEIETDTAEPPYLTFLGETKLLLDPDRLIFTTPKPPYLDAPQVPAEYVQEPEWILEDGQLCLKAHANKSLAGQGIDYAPYMSIRLTPEEAEYLAYIRLLFQTPRFNPGDHWVSVGVSPWAREINATSTWDPHDPAFYGGVVSQDRYYWLAHGTQEISVYFALQAEEPTNYCLAAVDLIYMRRKLTP